MHKIFANLLNRGGERGKRLQKNVVVSLFLKGISILVSLVLVPLTLNYLSLYEYGVWLTLSSVLVWINYFDIGLGNGLRNKLAEALAEKKMILGRVYVSTTFALLSIIIVCIIAIFFSVNTFLDWNQILNTEDNPIENISNVIAIVFSLCCVSFVMKIIGIIYIAHQEPMINDFFSCIGQVLSLIFIYILTKVTDGNLSMVAICFSFSPVLVYFLAYPYTFYVKYKKLRPSLKYIRWEYSKELGGLGFQFFILQIASLVLFSTSNIFISHLFSPSDVTPYNIAYKYMNIVAMIFSIIVTPLWTAITDAYVRKEFLWIKKSMSLMRNIWFCASLTLLILIGISKTIFTLWLGDSIDISYSMLFAMGAYISATMWNQIYASFANGIGRLTIQLRLAIAQVISFLILMTFLPQMLGVEGVAYALAISFMIGALGLYLDYNKIMNKIL